MTRPLELAQADLEKVLRRRNAATADRPRWVSGIELAEERMAAWAETNPPASSVGAERGGSSSPREVEDRQEARRLAVQVARDVNRLPLIVKHIELAAGVVGHGPNLARLTFVYGRVMSEKTAADVLPAVDAKGLETWTRPLAALVARYTETESREGRLPSEDSVPGCVSCARVAYRKGVKLGGHFAPVYEKAKKHKLCRWCYDGSEFAGEAIELPPVEACDIYHRRGPRSAGTWLAKRRAAA